MLRTTIPALLGLFFVPFATASDDLEYQDQVEEEKTKTLEVKGSFQAQWHEFNNLDFRPLDESSDQTILDSDDRSSLAFTGVDLGIDYGIDEHVSFVLGASHRGLRVMTNLGAQMISGAGCTLRLCTWITHLGQKTGYASVWDDNRWRSVAKLEFETTCLRILSIWCASIFPSMASAR